VKGTHLVHLRLPALAISSWGQLASHVERRCGECVARRLFLSRRDYEALRANETERDPDAAGLFFRQGTGPYVAPLLGRGVAIYEQPEAH
jgi:hypothetical protein